MFYLKDFVSAFCRHKVKEILTIVKVIQISSFINSMKQYVSTKLKQ